jgi:hypothetical protein
VKAMLSPMCSNAACVIRAGFAKSATGDQDTGLGLNWL